MQNKRPRYKKQLQTKFTFYLINIHGVKRWYGVQWDSDCGIQIVGSWRITFFVKHSSLG